MFLEAVWSLWKRWEDSHSTKTTFMLCALQQSGVFFSLFLMELIHKHPFVLQLSNENKVKRTSVIFDCAGLMLLILWTEEQLVLGSEPNSITLLSSRKESVLTTHTDNFPNESLEVHTT